MIISSDEEPDVPPRAALDGRTLDVIVREIVRGRPGNLVGREALLVGGLLSHLYW